MFLRFKTFWQAACCLLWVCTPALADNQPKTTQENEICYFYEFIKGTKDHSDPANQVSHFIKNRWIELENDLARGHGDELTYLNGMARCAYVLPEKLWENNIKGLPYEQRASTFTQLYLSKCFCARQ